MFTYFKYMLYISNTLICIFHTYLNINISKPRITTAKNTQKLKKNPTLVESFKVPSETQVSTKSPPPPKSQLKSYSE